MDSRHPNQTNRQPTTESQTRSQPSPNQQTSSDQHVTGDNSRTGFQPEPTGWSRLEQKLLFALLYTHPSAWQKYSRCFPSKTKPEVVGFVRNSFENLRRCKSVSVLAQAQSGSGGTGTYANSIKPILRTAKRVILGLGNPKTATPKSSSPINFLLLFLG